MLSIVEEYESERDTWCYLEPMLKPRFDHSAVTIDDRFIYVFGGKDEGENELYSIERYAYDTRTWFEINPKLSFSIQQIMQPLDDTVYIFGTKTKKEQLKAEFTVEFDVNESPVEAIEESKIYSHDGKLHPRHHQRFFFEGNEITAFKNDKSMTFGMNKQDDKKEGAMDSWNNSIDLDASFNDHTHKARRSNLIVALMSYNLHLEEKERMTID
jgi:hypothetical protein